VDTTPATSLNIPWAWENTWSTLPWQTRKTLNLRNIKSVVTFFHQQQSLINVTRNIIILLPNSSPWGLSEGHIEAGDWVPWPCIVVSEISSLLARLFCPYK
jgi:hypothetical protein